MWVEPYNWLEPVSEIQRCPYESRVPQVDPISGLPQPHIKKKAYLIASISQNLVLLEFPTSPEIMAELSFNRLVTFMLLSCNMLGITM